MLNLENSFFGIYFYLPPYYNIVYYLEICFVVIYSFHLKFYPFASFFTFQCHMIVFHSIMMYPLSYRSGNISS